MIATSRLTVDTNILIYSVDSTDEIKHSIAEHVMDKLLDLRAALPLQCLNEFYRSTTSKRLIEPARAESTVRAMMDFFQIVPAETEDVLAAIAQHRQYKTSYFDALLLATAARAGCTTLFSEDFQHNRTYGAITVRNPFTLPPTELQDLLHA